MDRLWDYMVENGIATNEELELVCAVCGGSQLNTLKKVLYLRTGSRDWEQDDEELED